MNKLPRGKKYYGLKLKKKRSTLWKDASFSSLEFPLTFSVRLIFPPCPITGIMGCYIFLMGRGIYLYSGPMASWITRSRRRKFCLYSSHGC
jgi:hypothetical protein